MHIASIIIGFAIGACASGIIMFAFFQRRKKESVADNKFLEDQIVKKDISDNADNTSLLFTLDEVGKIIFGEDEDGQTSEPVDDEYDGLRISLPISK